MLFDYLLESVSDPYVKDELRKWGQLFKFGVPCTQHRVETRSKSKGITIRFDQVAVKMSEEQAKALADQILEVIIEKSIRIG